MTIKEYIALSARTDADLGDFNNSLHWRLGAVNEFGEFLSPLKKAVVKGEDPDREKLVDELGDVFWYVAKGARLTGFSLPETYGYLQATDLITFIKQFHEYWGKEDVMGLLCVLIGLANFYEIEIPEILIKNLAKLQARHPEGFDINNQKYTDAEIEAIGEATTK